MTGKNSETTHRFAKNEESTESLKLKRQPFKVPLIETLLWTYLINVTCKKLLYVDMRFLLNVFSLITYFLRNGTNFQFCFPEGGASRKARHFL